MFDAKGLLSGWNPAATRLLGRLSAGERCCDLLGCRTGALGERCLSELARLRRSELPEVRIDLPQPMGTEEAVWATASRLAADDRIVVEVRHADPRTAAGAPCRTGPRRRG